MDDRELELTKTNYRRLYDEAGEFVEEDEDQISLTRYSHLLVDTVALTIEHVIEKNPLPFDPGVYILPLILFPSLPSTLISFPILY